MFFVKMQGAGNDYIFVLPGDCGNVDRSALARRISDRHFGVGSDGLVFIDDCDSADFSMDFYNSDGSHAEICGNALRCVARLVCEQGMAKSPVRIKTAAGILSVEVQGDLCTAEFGSDGVDCVSQDIVLDGRAFTLNCLNVGNPHAVMFLKDGENAGELLIKYGRAIENHPIFPEKTNVEFAATAKDGFSVRVWERGAGETLACGSGAVAVFAAAASLGLCEKNAAIHMRGGDLTVESRDGRLYLLGGAETVFTGNYKI